MPSPAVTKPTATARALALSPSRIDTAKSPYRYQQTVVRKQAEPKNAAMMIGGMVHEVAAAYLRHLQDSGHSTDYDELDRLAGVQWAHRPPEVPEEAQQNYLGFIAEFRNVSIPAGHSVQGIECQLAFDESWAQVDWFSAAAYFRTIFDFVTVSGDRVHIHDWTTAHLGGQFRGRKDLQLRAYGLAAWKTWGIADVEITTHSVRNGVRVITEIGEDDHADTEARIRAERERLEALMQDKGAKPWPAIPGEQCAFCRIACPLEQDALNRSFPIRLKDEDEARLALETYLLVDRRHGELKDLLKGYVQVNGPIQAGGKEAAFRSRTSRNYPTVELYKAMRAAGYEAAQIFDVLRADYYGLQRLLKADRALAERVEEIVQVEESEAFYPAAAVQS